MVLVAVAVQEDSLGTSSAVLAVHKDRALLVEPEASSLHDTVLMDHKRLDKMASYSFRMVLYLLTNLQLYFLREKKERGEKKYFKPLEFFNNIQDKSSSSLNHQI